ncbi:MAG: Uma2 family endonuclease [Planctomycetia bacterium]|nr:Uma2 family endonuclease [Planctomycetia bacterium]
MIVQATPVSAEQRFLLRNIEWPQYLAFADLLDERHVRLTFDGKNLELMTISHGHERWGELLGRFIDVLTEELDRPMQSGGSTTLNREDIERGLEPDRCYYLEHEPLVRDKDEIDLTVDPPPDLAVEIEVSRSCLNRMAIYAALKVPELWRFDGSVLRIYHLGADGSYVEATASRHFPFLPIPEVQAFLLRRGQLDETKLVKSFRQWVREQIARGWA